MPSVVRERDRLRGRALAVHVGGGGDVEDGADLEHRFENTESPSNEGVVMSKGSADSSSAFKAGDLERTSTRKTSFINVTAANDFDIVIFTFRLRTHAENRRLQVFQRDCIGQQHHMGETSNVSRDPIGKTCKMPDRR